MTIKETKNEFSEDTEILLESPKGYTNEYKVRKQNFPIIGETGRKDYAVICFGKGMGLDTSYNYFINKLNKEYLEIERKLKIIEIENHQFYKNATRYFKYYSGYLKILFISNIILLSVFILFKIFL